MLPNWRIHCRDDEIQVARDFADLCCSDKDDDHEGNNGSFVEAFINGCESQTQNLSLIQNKLGVASMIMRCDSFCI